MFVQIIFNRLMHGIKNEIYTLPASEFSCRDKVAISCDEDYLIYLTFESHRCNINADSHINALLRCHKIKVAFIYIV